MHRKRRLLALVLSLGVIGSLAGCAEGLDTKVTRFSAQLPPPPGQSFAIVPEDPRDDGGIEFGQYAADVAAHLTALGYAQAPSPAAASLIVHLGYGVDQGRQVINSSPDPWFGPWRGYRGWGGGWGWGAGWGWGWYDPWFDSSTVYTSDLDLRIDARADGQRLFEGHAEAVSSSNRLQYLVPKLVSAMFTGFPGNSGQTMRITIAPERR